MGIATMRGELGKHIARTPASGKCPAYHVGQAFGAFSVTLPTNPSQTTTSAVPLKDVVALDVAEEIEVGGTQQFASALDHLVALDRLPRRCSADPPSAAPCAPAPKPAGRAHDAELQQMLGLQSTLAPRSST
jgi:hypothetical protein